VVHLSGGAIEAHFHFFVMLALLSAYQDWVPFLFALAFVILEHGIGGVLIPSAVYNHPDAEANPWRWALIHGGFVLAAAAANVYSWTISEEDHRIASRMAEATARARESGTLYDFAIAALRDREAIAVLSNLCERAREAGQLTAISLVEVRPGEARTLAGDELSEDQLHQARRAYEEGTDPGSGVLDCQLTELQSRPPKAGTEYVVLRGGIAVIGLPARLPDESEGRLVTALLGLTSLVLERRRTAAVMEEERERIARDIHDDTLQTLGAMALRLDLLREEIRDTRQREVIEQLLPLVRDSSDHLRTIVFELRSDLLAEGLATAIGAATRDQAAQAGFEHRVTVRLSAEPPVEVALALYRIAQEALTNVRKHGEATRVDVCLAEENGALCLRVVDDGKGFEVAAATERLPTGAQARTHRFGLRSMSERAQLVGGQLTVRSAPGQGTVVEARVPVGATARTLTAG
jgi:signal transduction histidine kinase